MNVVEITGVDSGGTPTVFYISDKSYVTTSFDTPAHTAFIPALQDPGSIGLNLFADGVTGGAVKFEIGEIVIANSGGDFDNWLTTYGFDGQTVLLRHGDPAPGYPAGCPVIMVGTIDSVEADFQTIIVRLRDGRFVFNRPILTDVYLGNNVLPNGVEGTANDVKGKVKPRVYGTVTNVSRPCINTAKQIYQMSDRFCDVTAVYDAGVALTPGFPRASLAALQSTTPAAGSYDYFLGPPAYFRLGSDPIGEVTFDGGATGGGLGSATAATVAFMLATDAGVASISSSDRNDVNAANGAVVGINLDDGKTFQEALDEVLSSVGAAAFFDTSAQLRMGILTAPSGTPVLSLAPYDIIGVPSRFAPDDVPIPAWSVTVNYGKNYTVQDTGLAAGTTTARRALVGQERRSTAPAQDSSVKLQHPMSPALSIDTLFADPTNMATDAATEAARLLALYKVSHCFYKVTISDELFSSLNPPPKFLDVIQLTYPRFGLDAGQIFRLTGVTFALAKKQVILTLWG